MEQSNKNNRVHPRELYLRSKISEYSGYVELLKKLLGKHGETHDKAIEALNHEIYSLHRKLLPSGPYFH